jgi:hypothetical protein
MLEHEELTGQIIGAAIEVHKALGPGLLEDLYENAICVELRHRKIPFERQVPLAISYRGQEIGHYLADIHFVTVRSYLHAAQRQHALLLNFGKPTLDVKRVNAARFRLKAV